MSNESYQKANEKGVRERTEEEQDKKGNITGSDNKTGPNPGYDENKDLRDSHMRKWQHGWK